MAHEISETKFVNGKWRNYATSKKTKNRKRPLRTGGRHTFVSEREAVHAAKLDLLDLIMVTVVTLYGNQVKKKNLL